MEEGEGGQKMTAEEDEAGEKRHSNQWKPFPSEASKVAPVVAMNSKGAPHKKDALNCLLFEVIFIF